MGLKVILGVAIGVILITTLTLPITADYSEDDTLEVLIIGGQSNAEYWPYGGERCNTTELNEEFTKVPTKNLYYYGLPNMATNILQTPEKCTTKYMYSDGQYQIGSYDPILGQSITEKSGRDCLILDIGVGGLKISELLPGTVAGDWGFNIIERALKENSQYTIHMVGLVWIQGEADKDTPVEEYMADFKTLQTAFSKLGVKDYYAVHTRDYYGGNANTAQELLADQGKLILTSELTESFTEENGMLVSGDPIHYSQKGRTAIAMELKDLIKVNPPQSQNMKILTIIPIVLILAVITFVAYNMYLNRFD